MRTWSTPPWTSMPTIRPSGTGLIADEINAGNGPVASERRIWRLCSENGILSVIHRRRRSGLKAGPPVHGDLIERDFSVAAPDELWRTDITEHPTAERKIYLCAVKDVYSGRIVGYSMDSRMKSSLAVTALQNAVLARRPAGTVVHSDRGSQFRSRRFVESLRHHGLTGSTSGPRIVPVPAGQGHQLVQNLALAHPLRTGIVSGHFLRHRPALTHRKLH
jgi:hypothetical protein